MVHPISPAQALSLCQVTAGVWKARLRPFGTMETEGYPGVPALGEGPTGGPDFPLRLADIYMAH